MKRPAFFVCITIVLIVVSWLAGMVTAPFGENGGGFIGGVINLLITTFVDLGMAALLLKAFDDISAPKLQDLWHPHGYLPYLAATILMAIIVVLGFFLLIVPGIIAAVMLMFTKFVVIDRGMGPIEALKESARITAGHRLTLFYFMIILIVLNVAGAFLLVVPLLVTIPVSGLSLVYAYRTLGHKASEVVSAQA